MVNTRSGTNQNDPDNQYPGYEIEEEAGTRIQPPPYEFFVQNSVAKKAYRNQYNSTVSLNRLRERSKDAQWLNGLTQPSVNKWKSLVEDDYEQAKEAYNDLVVLSLLEQTEVNEKRFIEAIEKLYTEFKTALVARETELEREAEILLRAKEEEEALALKEAESLLQAKEEEETRALKEALNLDKENPERKAETNSEPELGGIFGGNKPPPPQIINEVINIEIDDEITMQTEPVRLPSFNGDKENWVLFREQFLTFVHNRKKLNDATKMQYLLSHLVDRAARVVKGITPVASNYERAWRVLNDRFNNDQILINHHLKRFFNLTPLSRDDPFRLTSIVDGVNELINSLPGLNEPMKNWDSILIFCIFNKLDHATQEAWKHHCMEIEKPSLNQMIRFLERRAQTNATANSSLLGNHNRSEQKKPAKRGVYAATMAKGNISKCKLCGEEHPLYRCIKFRELSVKNRWTKAKECRVCIKCLSIHDPKQKCNFEKCPVCGQGHNRLLCYEDEKKRNESEETTLESTIKKANVNHIVLKGDVASILGTIEVEVLNTIAEVAKLRCLNDPGSQLNLITEAATRELGLCVTPAKIQLNGVGDQDNGLSKGITTVKIGPNFGGKFTFEAVFFVVSKITMPLPAQRLPIDWMDRSSIGDLADPNFHEPSKIDALLGVNVWAAIAQSGIRRVHDNLIGHKTKLGWILCGSLNPRYGLGVKRQSYISAILTEQSADDIMNNMSKWWEVQEPPKKKYRTNAKSTICKMRRALSAHPLSHPERSIWRTIAIQ